MIDMILIRPTQINGVQYAAGARVNVDAGMAAQLLQTTRARLEDPADLALVIEGVNPRRRPIVGRFVMTR